MAEAGEVGDWSVRNAEQVAGDQGIEAGQWALPPGAWLGGRDKPRCKLTSRENPSEPARSLAGRCDSGGVPALARGRCGLFCGPLALAAAATASI